MPKPTKGFFTDYLSLNEVNFSKAIANELLQKKWTETLFKDNKMLIGTVRDSPY